MSARITGYCDALVTLLNTPTFTTPVVVVRKNFPQLEREDLDDGNVVCYVSPGGQSRSVRSRDGFHTRRFEIAVHLAMGLDPTDRSETDVALDLAEEIEDYIEANGMSLTTGVYTAGLESISQEDVMGDDSLHQRNEYETVISLEYEEAS